jgi:hypothetical protein
MYNKDISNKRIKKNQDFFHFIGQNSEFYYDISTVHNVL